MNQDKILSLIGLAMRGGNVVSGELQVENAIKDGSAVIVLIASDASKNTSKKFTDKCSFYEVPAYEYSTKALLGKAIGKEERSVVGVTNVGLSESIEKEFSRINVSIKNNGGEHGEN